MAPTSLDQAAVNSFLSGLRYPLWRADLARLAVANSVSDELMAALLDLPDREYRSRDDVVEQLLGQKHRIS